MKRLGWVGRILLCALLPLVAFGAAAALAGSPRVEPGTRHQKEVIYGRKHGMALTLDVFTPETPHGRGCILAVSGGWISHRGRLSNPLFDAMIRGFTGSGYTVFAVVHGSQPKYTIPEILEDMHRAVRFIRYHARSYGVDPERIGITGGSAGGHLSLMQGAAGLAGRPDAEDPVERESSRVAAVACFFPPSDFLNYGRPGEIALGRGLLENFRAPFAFQRLDPEIRAFVPVTDVVRILEIGRMISPVTHVSKDDPPTLIIHGDEDKIVPLQQGQAMVEALSSAGVEAKLVVKQGGGHGWPDIDSDIPLLIEWFDAHLDGGR